MDNTRNKIIDPLEAVKLINDGDTLVTGGFCGVGFAEELAISLQNHYLENGNPKNLTLFFSAGQGDFDKRGLNHLGEEGLLCKVIGGFLGASPRISRLVTENKIQAYNLPQGVISHMFRDIAAGNPRTISSVGLGTFVDPRNDGGKINSITTEDLIELVKFDGKEYLSYKLFPLDIAFLRGTTADSLGNITMEKEALTLESQAIAMAVKNSGGKVIVQVENIVEAHTLKARDVEIPGIFVDHIVLSKKENHWQTFEEVYNPLYSSEERLSKLVINPMELNARKIISRRAAMELTENSVVNLGIGMPEGIAAVAAEENILHRITLTAEPGVIGGMPLGGLNFGTAINTDAVIAQPSQFDFYHGGGLDIAFLGFAQADKEGNINVSKFGSQIKGAGGFIDISQNTEKVVFCGTFTGKGLNALIDDQFLRIVTEGSIQKFPELVEQITFSGDFAKKSEKEVLIITERCVFRFTQEGLVLIEIAPGIDLEKDILANMNFIPKIDQNLIQMDKKIFSDGIMGNLLKTE